MKGKVFRLSHDPEVVWVIIPFVAINMVNNLACSQRAT